MAFFVAGDAIRYNATMGISVQNAKKVRILVEALIWVPSTRYRHEDKHGNARYYQ